MCCARLRTRQTCISSTLNRTRQETGSGHTTVTPKTWVEHCAPDTRGRFHRTSGQSHSTPRTQRTKNRDANGNRRLRGRPTRALRRRRFRAVFFIERRGSNGSHLTARKPSARKTKIRESTALRRRFRAVSLKTCIEHCASDTDGRCAGGRAVSPGKRQCHVGVRKTKNRGGAGQRGQHFAKKTGSPRKCR